MIKVFAAHSITAVNFFTIWTVEFAARRGKAQRAGGPAVSRVRRSL